MNTTQTSTSRPYSSGPGSSSASSVDQLPPLPGLNRNTSGLPEEWTLPHEWKMEKRELFDNWKMDLQNQIANMATTLNHSLQNYPHPDVGRHFDYSDKVVQAEMDKTKRLQSAEKGTNSLLYGLARIPHAQQF